MIEKFTALAANSFMEIQFQNLTKEKSRAPRLRCEARPDDVPRTSLRRIRLKPEGVLADAKKHRLRRIDAEKPVTDCAADFRVLVLEMALVVLLEDAEHLVHLPLVGRMEQDVGHVIPQILAAVAENGERTIPGRAEFRLQDVAELLFADFGHFEASFQGSELSSQRDSISIHSNHNNLVMSNKQNRNSIEFLFRIHFEKFFFSAFTKYGSSLCF